MFAILSAVLPQEGIAHFRKVSRDEAVRILAAARENGSEVKNFVGHQTVKILGLTPAQGRPALQERYAEALVIKPNGRLEPGREYSLEEIEAIGYTIWYIHFVE